MISASVLVSCLNIDQSGSAYDYIVAISNLSISHPEVWTRYYRGSGKKSALTRLCQFLSRGSQGGPEDYWIHVKTLISHVPSDVLLPTLNERAEEDLDKEPPSPSPVLAALREGLRNRNETRSNQATIWRVYLDVATLVQSALQSFQDRQRFIKASVLPLVVQFVKPLPERTAWTVSSPNAQDLVVYACRLIFRTDPKIFEQEWRVLSTQIIEDLQTSLPEQSKEFTKSQDFLSAEVGKWYALQAAIVKSYEAMRPILLETVPSEILSAINTLKARNGKPYGAAAALEYSVESVPELVFEREDIKATIVEFMVKDVPDLILSPSAKYFVNILDALDGTISIHSGYRACLNALAQAPESAVKSIALQSFISSPCLASTASLFEVVMSSLRQALRSDEASYWEIVMAAVSNPHAPTELTDEIFAQMIEGLSVDAENSTSLRGLEKTMQQDKGKLRNFALSPSGSALISRLLLLTDSPDESISQRAKKLNVRVESVLAVDGVTGQATNSMMEIVNRGLETAGEYSLSYATLLFIV